MLFRSRDGREVHQAVRRAVEAALAQSRAPGADAGAGAADGGGGSDTGGGGGGEASATFGGARFGSANSSLMPLGDGAPAGAGGGWPGAAGRAAWAPAVGGGQSRLGLQDVALLYAQESAPRWAGAGSAPAATALNTRATSGEETAAWPLGRALAQLAGAFILAENAQGLVVVDMHAAHERIVYERLKTAHAAVQGSDALASQPLLIPATFAATPTEIATAESQTDALAALGLDVAPLSPGVLAVRARPAALPDADPVALARAVLAELGEVDGSRLVQDRKSVV